MNMSNNYLTGKNCTIQDDATVGLKYKDDCQPVKMGENCVIRAGTIIYGDVILGNYIQTGHNAMIRENTVIGDHVVIGTNVVIDGNVTIGNFVKIETNCYIPTHVKIGNRVFFGPVNQIQHVNKPKDLGFHVRCHAVMSLLNHLSAVHELDLFFNRGPSLIYIDDQLKGFHPIDRQISVA